MKSLPYSTMKIWCLLMMVTTRCAAELFTSMAYIDSLLDSSREVARIIDAYVAHDERRIVELKKLSQLYKSEKIEMARGNENIITNPLDSYVLVKRMADNWRQAERLMRFNAVDGIIRNYTGEAVGPVGLPGDEDVIGMAVGLMRLQDVYKLNTYDMAEGRIKGVTDGHKLTAEECLEIARIAYNKQDFYHTLMWAQEALDRVRKEKEPTIDETDALEYLAYAMYKQGNVEWALHYTLQLKRLDPNHPRVQGNIKFYQDALNPEGTVQEPDPRVLSRPRNKRPIDLGIPERDTYEALCRNEFEIKEKDRANLYCYYKSNRPFLKLAPIKVEVMHWKPKIVYFRQVMSDEEIAVIKELAMPILKRATVHNAATGKLETAAYRISKSAWLKDLDHPVVRRVCERIDMMTDLSMDTAELLQIANYGIGGHYDPHFDMSTNANDYTFESLNAGNRIATVLFYVRCCLIIVASMSQPEAGGGTVFTTHKITVTASKHDAAFWFNVLHNGEPDTSTLHAACPVLAGTKWVANKWIHERGQEFRRPCALKQDDYYDEQPITTKRRRVR
ncbi:tetratricopeptide repeat protein [Trichuris suis]|nr:tetratricopeptide repeat protein [Trichuris suis]